MSHNSNSSKFDNISNFLDQADSNVFNDHHKSVSGNISPLTQQTHNTHSSEGSKYVDFMSYLSEHDRVVDPTIYKKSGGNSTNSSYQQYKNKSESQASINEITNKVNAMQLELQEKRNLTKSLLVEYQQMRNDREIKLEKVRSKWEKQLKNTREELANTLNKSKDIEKKVLEELKHYELRKNQLQERISVNEELKKEIVQNMSDSTETQLKRLKRQLEEEDNRKIEKDVNKQIESIKRNIRESLAPEFENIVKNNKLSINNKISESEISYIKLKKYLQVDYDKKLNESKSLLQNYIKNQEKTFQKHSNEKINNILLFNDNEIENIKEKNNNIISILEENHEKLMLKNQKNHIEKIEKLIQQHKYTIDKMKANYKLEIENIHEKHHSELLNIQNNYQNALKKFELKCKNSIKNEQMSYIERSKVDLRSKCSIEIEQVLQRMREEGLKERNAMQNRYDDDLDELRLKHSKVLDELNYTLEKCRERLHVLRKEIEITKKEKNELTTNIKSIENELSDRKDTYLKVRLELRSLEDQESSQHVQNSNSIHHHVDEYNKIITNLTNTLNEQQEEYNRLDIDFNMKKDKLQIRLQVRCSTFCFV